MEPENGVEWDGKTQLTHYEETDKYNLKVILSNKVMNVILTILTSGIVYSKQFKAEDIQQTIGKGWCDDLFDILMIFMSEKDLEAQLNKNDESRVKQSLKTHKKIDNYQFGLQITNGMSKYSIMENGSIKIMSQLDIGGKIKKRKIFKGEIKLLKVRQINDRDIYEHKLRKVQRQFQQQLKNYVPKTEIAVYQTKIASLQDQIQKYRVATKFMSTNNKYYFSFQGRKIIKIIDNNWTQLPDSRAIQYDQIQSFKIRVIKTSNRNIFFGVMDRNSAWGSRSVFNSNSAISYYATDGSVKLNGGNQKVQGGGYQVNDIVQMQVQLSKGIVTWKVNQQIKCKYQNSGFLADKNRHLCPFIELYNRDDIIEWLS